MRSLLLGALPLSPDGDPSGPPPAGEPFTGEIPTPPLNTDELIDRLFASMDSQRTRSGAEGAASLAIRLATFYRSLGIVPAHPCGEKGRGCHYPEDFLEEACQLLESAALCLAGEPVPYRATQPARTDT